VGNSDAIRTHRKYHVPEPIQEVRKRNGRFPDLTQGLTNKIDEWVHPDPNYRSNVSAAYIADFLKAYLY
jgi:hypothetical protein